MVAYLSMGFGNPYGDPWHAAMVGEWCGRLHAELDIRTIALSDTVGRQRRMWWTPFWHRRGCLSEALRLLHGRPNKRASDGGGMKEDVAPLVALGWARRLPDGQDDLVGNLPTEVLIAAPQNGARKKGSGTGTRWNGPNESGRSSLTEPVLS